MATLNTWKNGEHVDHDPIVEARAARRTRAISAALRLARSAVAIQTGCRAACREQTAADVLEARKALLLFLSVRRVVYEKGPVRSLSMFAQAVTSRVMPWQGFFLSHIRLVAPSAALCGTDPVSPRARKGTLAASGELRI